MSGQSGKTLCVIGLGLIGGSVARAARASGLYSRILAVDADAEQIATGIGLGVIDAGGAEPAAQLAEADLVLLAVPVAATGDALLAIAPHLRADAVITDVGSTKQSVVAAAQVLGAAISRFVPGHPIAGTERSGVAAGSADLFLGRRVILTPLPETEAAALAGVQALWAACGASVCEMSPQHHDEVLAATSHLPHLLAYALVDCLATMEARREIFAYAAGGFRDFTRIASSSPRMWHDIVRANRPAVLEMLDQFTAHLQGLRDAVAEDDGNRIIASFSRARDARERFVQLVESAEAAQA